jgi:hypothetical protein
MINLPIDFVPGYRYYNVHGTKSSDAKFEVYIDGNLIDNPFVDIEQFDPYHSDLGPTQYAFSVEHSFLGAIPIKIHMLQGSMTLTRARAFYPAKITNSKGNNSFGYYSLFQPIGDPKWFVKINDQLQTLEEQDQHLTGEVHHSITSGDVLEYLHAMVEGPRYWCIAYSQSTHNQIIDQQDSNIESILGFDNQSGIDYTSGFDRLNILKNQLSADYKNS